MRICYHVTEVAVAGPLTLTVAFVDGTTGVVRFEPSHLHGIYTPLADPAFFAKAHVDHGAVAWPGDIDIAPDAMYDEIKARGEWVLR